MIFKSDFITLLGMNGFIKKHINYMNQVLNWMGSGGPDLDPDSDNQILSLYRDKKIYPKPGPVCLGPR